MDLRINQIRHTLDVLFQPGETVELRCVGDRTINGFYRDLNKLATDAARLNSSDFNPPQNIYVCLNPVQPELFARRADQFAHACKGEGVRDQDVHCRRFLLIDIDAVRPAGVSATNEQKQTAVELAKSVYAWLQEQLGRDGIVCADSGNGAHMLLRLPDRPADQETAWVCERFLELLHERFSNSDAKIDTTTANAARICTLYGTVKRKGSDLPEQPHRISRLVHAPDPLRPVDWAKLASLVQPYPGDQRQPMAQPRGDGWDIDALLQQHQIAHARDDNYLTNNGDRATRWELGVCPFNPDHNDRSAVIVQFPSGAVSFRCHHDGCSGNDWTALKPLWALRENGITAADITLPTQPPAELLIVSSLDVNPEPIAWLWQDRFVIGGINLCAGRGGIGKTYFLCDLVARITNPALLAPDGQPLQHGRVLYSTGEDHVAKVVEPRMQKHAVDRGQLEYIKGLPDGPYLKLLDVVEHCDLLRDALRKRPDTVALVLDPISSFQGGSDSNKVSQVRQFTAVLTQLGEEFDIAIIGIHHFNKGKRNVAGDAISGSHAYRDSARSIWLFALDSNDPTRRMMACDKHNWAEHCPPGLAYRIEAGVIQYEAEPLEMTSDELMAQGVQKSQDIACAWLVAQLSTGPQPAANIQAAAAIEGISERTLNRAKKSLGITSSKTSEHWQWSLPANEEPAT